MRIPKIATLAAIILGAASLMIPAFLVGHPNVFPDTTAYELVGQWFLEQAGINTSGGYAFFRHRADLAMFFTIAGARSPYYGVLLYAVTAKGSAWAMAALQALLASSLIALAVRTLLGRFRLVEFAAIIALLSLASTLSYFVSFMMPDVFLGLCALAALLLLTAFDRLYRTEFIALGVGLALTLPFHATNSPVIFCAAVAAGGALWMGLLAASPARRGLAVVGAAIGFSLVASALYPVAVASLAHRELSRPPFLSARLLADGPGRAYLHKACATGAPFALCRYQDRPMVDANAILWSVDPRHGVFETSDYATRLAMTHQEPKFVKAVVAAYPGQTLWMLLRDSYLELTDVSVLDNLGYWDRGLINRGPRFEPPFPQIETCVRRPSYCTSTPFQRDSEDVLGWTLIASALYLGARLACAIAPVRRVLRLSPLPRRLAAAVIIVLVILLANAALCGGLSGVYARYQMRVAWLAPLMAGLAALEAWPLGLRRKGA